MDTIVFVSYSRKDYRLIGPIAGLLRAALAGVPSLKGNVWDVVFRDVDNILAGEEWERVIDKAIRAAERIFVFWCKHSAESEQVQREYEFALQLRKSVVPVLLDETWLPPTLSVWNGVDLRGLRLHERIRRVLPTPVDSPKLRMLVSEFGRALEVDPELMMQNLHARGFPTNV